MIVVAESTRGMALEPSGDMSVHAARDRNLMLGAASWPASCRLDIMLSEQAQRIESGQWHLENIV